MTPTFFMMTTIMSYYIHCAVVDCGDVYIMCINIHIHIYNIGKHRAYHVRNIVHLLSYKRVY
jgi:hypothetical protein